VFTSVYKLQLYLYPVTGTITTQRKIQVNVYRSRAFGFCNEIADLPEMRSTGGKSEGSVAMPAELIYIFGFSRG
jgi:hypothetical protein